MILHEMLKDEREAGKQEGLEKGLKEGLKEGRKEGLQESILDILEEKGEVSEELRLQILNEKDLNVLKKYVQQAVKAESIHHFIKAIF